MRTSVNKETNCLLVPCPPEPAPGRHSLGEGRHVEVGVEHVRRGVALDVARLRRDDGLHDGGRLRVIVFALTHWTHARSPNLTHLLLGRAADGLLPLHVACIERAAEGRRVRVADVARGLRRPILPQRLPSLHDLARLRTDTCNSKRHM